MDTEQVRRFADTLFEVESALTSASFPPPAALD